MTEHYRYPDRPGSILTTEDWERNRKVQTRLAELLAPEMADRTSSPVWFEAITQLRAELEDTWALTRTPMEDVAHREQAIARFELSIGHHAEALQDYRRQHEARAIACIDQMWAEHFDALGI
jgi:hypothetical protein